MSNFFKIAIFLSKDKKYLFCNCCLHFGEIIIGDYEQITLVNTLEESLNSLLDKLYNYESPIFDISNIKDIVDTIADDISNSCLPTFIESFDGDFGILCYVDNEEYLIIKAWSNTDLIKVNISKEDYIALIINALKEIDKSRKRL